MSKSNESFMVIKDRGTIAFIPQASEGDTLKTMQDAVGGYIELFLQVPSKSRPGVTIDFYCNEEGRLVGLEPNVLVDAGDGHLFDIVGPVLITAGSEETGETLGLTDEEVAGITLAPFLDTEWLAVTYA